MRSDWLSEQMKKFRVTQKEIAQVLGIDASGVSRLLAGQRKLTDIEVTRIRGFLMRRQRAYADGTIDVSEDRHPGVAPLEIIIWRARIPARELGRMAKLSDGRVEEALSGKSPLDAEEAAAIAAALDLPVEFIMGNQVSIDGDELDRRLKAIADFRNPVRKAKPSIAKENLMPVYAPPEQGIDGLHFSGRVAEYRPVPAPLSGVESAFGIFVGAGNYGPRFRAGDVMFVHPSKPPVHGKESLAILPAGSVLVVGTAEVDAGGNVSIRNGDDIVDLGQHGARAQRIVGAWWD